jgi:hypothetical protein
MATMITKIFLKPVSFLPAVTAAVLLSACASSQPADSGPADPKPVPAVKQGPDQDVIEAYGGDGMKIPLDGSSLAAFETSLEKVKRNTSPDKYETLTNAIEYLLVYDLAAQRDREKLAARLDGNNGYEVVDRVGWQKK